MNNEKNISEIFNEKPAKWSLRGDPYLWEELQNHFKEFKSPMNDFEFVRELHSAFEKYTGSNINTSEKIVRVSRYNHGGMSGGMVSPKFWIEKAKPLLLQRLKNLDKQKNFHIDISNLLKEQ